MADLECSEPTLSRVLKELRDTYAAEIKYSKANHTYQLIKHGLLDKIALHRMNEALALHTEMRTANPGSRVLLSKDRKISVSLSLRWRILRKIDRLATLSHLSRSEAVESIIEKNIEQIIDDLINQSELNKMMG
ncbi:MAG: hypothetical protein XXXJIFNMEKO3_01925 [Candidatus Erwinia impunctatus]|nr:hypothetical protein XXXJIFNMEKO_01925 [Culicoides impunctatus]